MQFSGTHSFRLLSVHTTQTKIANCTMSKAVLETNAYVDSDLGETRTPTTSATDGMRWTVSKQKFKY